MAKTDSIQAQLDELEKDIRGLEQLESQAETLTQEEDEAKKHLTRTRKGRESAEKAIRERIKLIANRRAGLPMDAPPEDDEESAAE